MKSTLLSILAFMAVFVGAAHPQTVNPLSDIRWSSIPTCGVASSIFSPQNQECIAPLGLDVTQPPINAKCDGHSDDSVPLQNGLNMAPSDGNILILIIPNNSQCNFASTLTMPNNSNIVMMSPGFGFLDYTGTTTAIHFANQGGDYQFKAVNMWFQIATSSTTVTPTYFQIDNQADAFLLFEQVLIEEAGPTNVPYFTAINMDGTNGSPSGSLIWNIGDTLGQVSINGVFGFALNQVNIIDVTTCLPIGLRIQNVNQNNSPGSDWNIGNNSLTNVSIQASGGACPVTVFPGYAVELDNNAGNFYFNNVQLLTAGSLTQGLFLTGTQASLSGIIDFSQLGVTWNTPFSANNLSVTTASNTFTLGPLTAPTGTCHSVGAVVTSQDGHATYCPSNGGSWTTKF